MASVYQAGKEAFNSYQAVQKALKTAQSVKGTEIKNIFNVKIQVYKATLSLGISYCGGKVWYRHMKGKSEKEKEEKRAKEEDRRVAELKAYEDDRVADWKAFIDDRLAKWQAAEHKNLTEREAAYEKRINAREENLAKAFEEAAKLRVETLKASQWGTFPEWIAAISSVTAVAAMIWFCR